MEVTPGGPRCPRWPTPGSPRSPLAPSAPEGHTAAVNIRRPEPGPSGSCGNVRDSGLRFLFTSLTSFSLLARLTRTSREAVAAARARLSAGPLPAWEAGRSRGALVAAEAAGDLVDHRVDSSHLTCGTREGRQGAWSDEEESPAVRGQRGREGGGATSYC